MTTREALLAAVYAFPDDDLPRLVLADHLDENGEPTRAEFIRLQIELCGNSNRPDLIVRQAELLADSSALLDPADREVFDLTSCHPVFDRGFLCGVEYPDFDADAYDPPIYPVEEVANDWHRLCDLAARSPLFHYIECPDWFTLELTPAGNHWSAVLVFASPQPCLGCEGDGSFLGGQGCILCAGTGRIELFQLNSRSRTTLADRVIRWQIPPVLFGPDHPLFQGD